MKNSLTESLNKVDARINKTFNLQGVNFDSLLVKRFVKTLPEDYQWRFFDNSLHFIWNEGKGTATINGIVKAAQLQEKEDQKNPLHIEEVAK